MNNLLTRLAMLFLLFLILSGYLMANIPIAFSSGIGGKIDAFTSKEPYNGKGLNVSSDAFGPEEVAFLYASVTYNGQPVANLLVAFSVQTPGGAFFSRAAYTNESGIAKVNFTIPAPPDNGSENEVFGIWSVLANVSIGEQVYQDALTFRVDWVVKLISIKTIDENLTYRGSFGREGDVGFEITVRNIAMILKRATLTVVVKDELNVPVGSFMIRDFAVQPNEKLIFLYGKLYLPKWTYVGLATIYVSAFTAPVNESGVPYCPTISTKFYVTGNESITVAFHDVAVVDVVPSTSSVELGYQSLGTSVLVRNEGTETESFNVSVYFDDRYVGTLSVASLGPYDEVTLNFTIDPVSFGIGNYTITSSIPPLLNEADLTDNTFVYRTVEIRYRVPSVSHDIAIVDVEISNNTVHSGEFLQINVNVSNKGTETESFSLDTRYDSSLIGSLQVNSLAAGAEAMLIFVWNTSSVREGFYQISAAAPLPDDANPADNTFVDGVVQILAGLPPELVHDVAVLNVSSSSTLVYVGDTADINVQVKNQGYFAESFSLTTYYDNNPIQTLTISNLQPGETRSVTFPWNTHGVPVGTYTLSATADNVLGETNTANNRYVDGTIELVKSPSGLYVPDWFFWIFLLLLLLLVILLLLLLYRRRKKESEGSFYSGWTAWYYGYDLRSRTRKT